MKIRCTVCDKWYEKNWDDEQSSARSFFTHVATSLINYGGFLCEDCLAGLAKGLGYEVIAVSPFEVGLIKDGKGIRTWWCSDFGLKLPPLSHPVIQETIRRHEAFLADLADKTDDSI